MRDDKRVLIPLSKVLVPKISDRYLLPPLVVDSLGVVGVNALEKRERPTGGPREVHSSVYRRMIVRHVSIMIVCIYKLGAGGSRLLQHGLQSLLHVNEDGVRVYLKDLHVKVEEFAFVSLFEIFSPLRRFKYF